MNSTDDYRQAESVLPNYNTIDIPEISQILKCSPQRVLTGLASGEFPGVKIGKAWVVPRGAFFQRLNDMANNNWSRAEALPAKTRRKGLL